MSFSLLRMAMDFTVPKLSTGTDRSTAKLILLCLADAQNDKTKQCFPSIKLISQRTHLDRKTVIKSLLSMQQAGIISATKIAGKSTRYEINTDALYSSSTSTNIGTGTNIGTSTSIGTTTCPNIGTTPVPILGHEPRSNLEGEPRIYEIDDHPTVSVDKNFESIWAIYPRRENRKQAEDEWQKLRPDEALFATIATDVQARIEAGHWDPISGKKYIPQLARYLSQQRWQDEIIHQKGKINRAHRRSGSPGDVARRLREQRRREEQAAGLKH